MSQRVISYNVGFWAPSRSHADRDPQRAPMQYNQKGDSGPQRVKKLHKDFPKNKFKWHSHCLMEAIPTVSRAALEMWCFILNKSLRRLSTHWTITELVTLWKWSTNSESPGPFLLYRSSTEKESKCLSFWMTYGMSFQDITACLSSI